MKKLLKSYELVSVSDYYEMIITSVINGQRSQAKNQFNEMPKENKKEFIKLQFHKDCDYNLSQLDKNMFIDLL